MIILGLETSCDETAAAVIRAEKNNISVLSNVVSSQIKLHAKWGGVVPNLAAREHLKNILPVIKTALAKAKVKPKDINLISSTNGPGLIPALLIGTSTAKTLSYLWQKPLLGIHHIEGHIYANFISDKIGVNSKIQISNYKQIQNSKNQNPKQTISYKLKANFPILCLVVSGGHTQLVLMKKHLDYVIIGETLDDAAGEAFDKVARILGLGYPGGPAISKIASAYKLKAISYKLSLPQPMINSKDFNFSFSGLKTAVLYKVKALKAISYKLKAELASEFQQAVIDVLVSKTIRAGKIYNPKTIMLAGGVSANKELRLRLGKAVEEELPFTSYKLPATSYSLDNAAMIAAAGYFRYNSMKNKKTLLNNWKSLQTDANLKLM
jgi:N6-L-threonylcarbamoyladenine synthase